MFDNLGLLGIGLLFYYNATRDNDLSALSTNDIDPELVLVAVTEKEIDQVLQLIPVAFRDRVILLQNELLPADWQKHGYKNPIGH